MTKTQLLTSINATVLNLEGTITNINTSISKAQEELDGLYAHQEMLSKQIVDKQTEINNLNIDKTKVSNSKDQLSGIITSVITNPNILNNPTTQQSGNQNIS